MKRLLAIVTVLFSASLILLGCEEPTKPEVIRPVKFLKMEKAPGFGGNKYPGRAEASTELNLGFEVSGPIERRPVDKGDMVKKGQLLAVLDLRDFKNEVAFAVAERKRNYAYRNRIAEALKSNAVSRQDLTDADARLAQSRAAVRIKQKAFEDAHIYAPFDRAGHLETQVQFGGGLGPSGIFVPAEAGGLFQLHEFDRTNDFRLGWFFASQEDDTG